MDLSHAGHAIATISELSIAMSIASIARVYVPAREIDIIERKTVTDRVEADSKTASFFLKIGYKFSDLISTIVRFLGHVLTVPSVALVIQLAVLIVLAFYYHGMEILLFSVSIFTFCVMLAYVIYTRFVDAKAGKKPPIDLDY